MKKSILALSALLVVGFYACEKSDDNVSQISLTASSKQVTVGETVSVTLTSEDNASNWTVSPASNVSQTYGITTSRINHFTFSQPGIYTVSVSTRKVSYDSTLHQSLDSSWNHAGKSGGCTKNVDTASVAITVLK